mmetsp:Transcript_29412/g.113878  ORF Transcript_29412/g.113878 Transcript_29412/m.113878 type:complete len:465 (-) Transcript_29412:810-2204(-)|eukprot:CAMPEP_0113953762 /NCGR_PEP_ID=MMETSP0011_2-20120614/23_1 /TAXON_ID=101924 /ORGANISM="Rhodosorus marinus" /LENGTH=464 /DNA_ID=CAMNT_0000962507 /DNA_START=125 /DNA_END=1519 /DNA_ORIENTATION=+ /assembly_acc=CAM_ASM_000156
MRFLVLFRGTFQGFRRPEFCSLVRLVGGLKRADAFEGLEPCWKGEGNEETRQHGDVFQWVELDSLDEARRIASRSVLIRAIFICWGHGRSYQECLDNVLETDPDMEPLLSHGDESFKCVIDGFGRSYSYDDQISKMTFFTPVLSKLKAKVRLKKPAHEIWIMEDVLPSKGHRHIPDRSEQPRQVFLGLKIADGGHRFASSYTLKKRNYIGTTSMDAELSFIMANQAVVKPGTLVMDPFVGTGSIIISASAFGAEVIGSDIDMNVLRGNEDKNIRSNFSQYNLNFPAGIIRCDLLKSPWRDGSASGGWLDAILCDPPYGIREGSRSFNEYEVPEKLKAGHIPQTKRVRFSDHLVNLLDFAARNLVAHGRLVFWLPTTPDYSDEDVPTHACMKLVSNCEQVLTMRFRRRLLTFEKFRSLERAELELELIRLTHGERSTKSAHTNLAATVLRQQHRREETLGLPHRK